MLTKDLLLEQMCLIEVYKEQLDEGYLNRDAIISMFKQLDKGLSEVYKLLCDDKLYY